MATNTTAGNGRRALSNKDEGLVENQKATEEVEVWNGVDSV